MASDNSSSREDSTNPRNKKEPDPRLDICSASFDPLLALSKDIKLPVKNARTYDNISMLDINKLLAGERPPLVTASTSHSGSKHSDKDKSGKRDEKTERRFKEHQMPVRSERRPKDSSNIFKKMEDLDGPLLLLKKCKNTNKKVKIVTRNACGIRGYCIGYVTAFDKHWNVALADIDEIWTRPKNKKVPAMDTVKDAKIPPHRKVTPPPIKIVSKDKKSETCSRHVDQYILRGEHIVTISVVKPSESTELKWEKIRRRIN